MALEDGQQKVWVDLATKYPEVVLCVGKIRFGEKARKKMPMNSKQDQKYTLACAVCALLNSGGGVVKAEIENEDYNLERERIGPDLEETFQSLLLFPDWTEYLDFEQRDNHLLIFIKTWSSKSTSSTTTKPRICSLSTGLHAKSGTSLSRINPIQALSFLKGKESEARRELSSSPPPKIRRNTMAIEGAKDVTDDTVAKFFNRDQLRRGEKLPFTESQYVEFKHYSTEKFLTRVKEVLPQYVAGFANAGGGYFWLGVDDESVVQGFSSSDEGLQDLNSAIDSVKDKLTLFHFCENGSAHKVRYEHRLLPVCCEAGHPCGYVCAVKIHPFTCVVFSEDPASWLVEGRKIRRVKAHEWAERMTDADPDLSKFSETFRLELSLTDGPPLAKPVYSQRGLDGVDDLCKKLFPVISNRIMQTPRNLRKGLFREHPRLAILMKDQLNQLSEGVLIFSRSWAAEMGLPENQDIICDALLVAQDRPPILYAVCKRPVSEDLFEYSRRVACRLKEKLVNTGGYIHKLCVIPKLLTLSPQVNCRKEWDLNVEEMYPRNYSLISSNNRHALMRALTVALLTFRSFLSDRVGFEFLNLLTHKQYQLLSENLYKTKKLYVYGLPGTGKTVVALQIIKKIRTMLQCSQEEVLYVCENQPLRDLVRQKNICQAETRVGFLKGCFKGVKHIIIDEAQNFRKEAGDWYEKALSLTSSQHLSEPGFFWIFLDYLQQNHCFETGLPAPPWHDPVESLTEVVRNASCIYNYLKQKMEEIVKLSTLHIPNKRLESLLCRATCAHAVQGHAEIRNLDMAGIAKYVAEHCQRYLKNGYSEKDIAVLCYTDEAARVYEDILASEIRPKLNLSLRRMEGWGWKEHAVLDSVRRFSGLERRIVFGIIPPSFPFVKEISRNVLVCVASRANLNLHLLFESSPHMGSSQDPDGPMFMFTDL